MATNILGRAVSTAHLAIEGEERKIDLMEKTSEFQVFLFLSAAPRLEVPENYLEGLIFRQDEVVRLKVPLVARPNPTVRIVMQVFSDCRQIFF